MPSGVGPASPRARRELVGEQAELLLGDEHLIQTSLGTALREIGKVDPDRRDEFLRRHEAQVSATTRRMARK